MPELHLLPAQANCVRRILWAHLPSGTRVSVFGSRATGRGLKPHSDLDLLIDCPVELPLMAMADVREALAESDLPFSVDLLDRKDAGAEFLSRLEHEGTIDLHPLLAEPAPADRHSSLEPRKMFASTVTEATLIEITRRLVATYQPEQVVLFGSHAWGEPDESSDVDLLVVVSESAEPAYRRASAGYRSLFGLGVPCDVWVRTREEVLREAPLPTTLTHKIVREGKVLYG